MQKHPRTFQLRVRINRVDASAVKRARAADQAVNFVAFREQKLREIRTVLAGDPGDERFFGHKSQIASKEASAFTSSYACSAATPPAFPPRRLCARGGPALK